MHRALLLTFAFALPTSAHAATWSPSTVSRPHTAVNLVNVAERGDGALVAGWAWQDGAGVTAPRGAATAVRLPGSATFGSEQPTIPDLLDLRPYAQSQTIELGVQRLNYLGLLSAYAYRVHAVISGGAPQALADVPIWRRPVLAAAARTSSALVAWVQVAGVQGGTSRRIVQVAERRGGAWLTPYPLSGRGEADQLAAAVGPRGDAVVAFTRETQLLARVRRPGGTWGPLQTILSERVPSHLTVRAAIDARGNVLLAWRRQIPGTVTALEATIQPDFANTFLDRQTLRDNGARAGFSIAPVTQGWAVADVEDVPGARYVFLHRTFWPGSRFAPPVAVAPAVQGDVREASVLGRPNGDIMVGWTQPPLGPGTNAIARAAAFSNPAHVFGPVEDVASTELAGRTLLGAGQGPVTAVWSGQPRGLRRSLVFSATRTP